MSTTKNRIVGIILCGACLLTTATVAHAQSKAGTAIGEFLLIEPSARVAAMGNAGVTTFREAMSAFYNPGAIGHMVGSDAQFTHSLWLAGITYNYAAVATRLGSANTVLLTVTSLNSGEMDVRTVRQPHGTGARFVVQDLAFGLGYTRLFTDRFSAGIQVKYVRQTIYNTSLSAMAVDFGMLYRLPFGAYIGASLSNFGTQGQFSGRDLRVRFDQNDDKHGDNSNLPAKLVTDDYPLPLLFRVGLGFPVRINASNRALFVVDAFQPSANTNSVSFGMEYTFMDAFSLRAGYQNLFQEDSEGGLTLGVGLAYDFYDYGLRFDYAWANYGRIGNAQRFTLGFSF